VVTVKCHQRNFKGDTLCYRQPVQRVSEYWRDVVASTDSGDQPRGGVQDGLQSSVDAVRDAVQKSVTVVDSACNECVDKRSQCITGQ